MLTTIKPKKKTLILYLLVPVLMFVFTVFVPLVTALVYSFFEWKGGPMKTFNGLANYKQLTKDNFFIIPKTVRARFNAPGGTDSSNMGWNSTKELKSIEYNADTGILSFYLTTSDSYSYGSYWTKSYSIDITGDLYCVF